LSKSRYPNRSQAVEKAISRKLDRLRHGRLARESAKLDPREEKGISEEGLGADMSEWPEY
jgi:hypothetical protein